MRSAWRQWLVGAVILAGAVCSAPGAQAAFSSGSTGADGPYAPTSSTPLTLPPTGVFNFTTITIPAGVTVTLAPNATNTPATLLATGDVTIAGVLDLSGQDGGNGSNATATAPNGGRPGPGGFAGGNGSVGIVTTTGGRGLGPGGGAPGVQQGQGWVPDCSGGGAGHNGTGGNAGVGYYSACTTAGGASYEGLLPLLGGSGEGAGSSSFGYTAGGGGGGGGALLLVSSTKITLTGTTRANAGSGTYVPGGNYHSVGGGGGGSGGTIRLVAPLLTGSGGSIQVNGGNGGTPSCVQDWIFYDCPGNGGFGATGRIRLEATTFGLVASMTVAPSQGPLGTVTLPNAPSLQFTSVAGVPAPGNPQGSYANPDLTLPAGFSNPVSVALQGAQIPVGTTVTVTVVPMQGTPTSTTGTLVGTFDQSTVTVNLTLPTNEPAVLTASATFPLVASAGTAPLYADGPVPSPAGGGIEGEEVTHVKVAAMFGEDSSVTYVTRSGREVRVR